MNNVNVLILSAGSRNKIVQYFKTELAGNGSVFATDCSLHAPALYDADDFFIVPRIDAPGYLETILDICRKNKIDGVLSLIDPELTLISKNIDKFKEIGVTPIISDPDVIEMSFDKYAMFKFMTLNDIPTVKTFEDIESFISDYRKNNINFPVFVKPRSGSASININLVHSLQDLQTLFSKYDNLIIQEYMDGVEIGVDAYIDLISGKLVSKFAKEKIKMRAGETDKSVSIKNSDITNLVNKLLTNIQFRGIIDIDIFRTKDGYFVSEVNPRFGGGYPHAYECGINIPKMIVNNLKKNENTLASEDGYDSNILMLKFNEMKIVNLNQSKPVK